MKSRFGFTLAEVLITLGIIGIVAEITVPTLMHSVQDAEFYSGAKKAFSVFSQATERMVFENSGSIWDASSSDATVLSKNMADEYAKYLYILKDDYIETMHPKDWVGYKSSIVLYGANSSGSRYGLLLKDGTTIRFLGWQNCGSLGGNLTNRCGQMLVDVNGNKPPNMFGRDAYIFYTIRDSNNNYKVVPAGPDTDTSDCSGSAASAPTNATSFGCTEYVLNNKPLPP